ncbi:hypothetical protein [Tardiphaga sp.]|uniref:hypothetical protein n=1 Tax=Tardiphaga sp. TaxID=1926292 RepID=UPI002637F3F5|nr:hypothetical protein [Tardiphaga sp.]
MGEQSMTKVFLLFGIDTASLDKANALVELLLRTKLEPRESSFHGGNYFATRGADGEQLLVKSNFDRHAGEWSEPQYLHAPFLLYVNATHRAAEIEGAIGNNAQISLLRRSTV